MTRRIAGYLQLSMNTMVHPATFSVPSILAVICAIVSFFVSAGAGLALAVIAIVLGLLGFVLALMPGVRGGVASAIAILAGVLGIIVSIIRLI